MFPTTGQDKLGEQYMLLGGWRQPASKFLGAATTIYFKKHDSVGQESQYR
jgi:hypothetical protein